MGRPKTATNVLDAKGAFKKNPGRKPKNEPKGKGVFDVKAVPDYFTPHQKSCWIEIIDCVPGGVLTTSDRLIVEIASVLLSEFRSLHGLIDTARITRLTSEMGKLGLSPSDRAKLTIDNKKKNTFDDL